MRNLCWFLICFIGLLPATAQPLLSPTDFLGYAPGTQFTPHHQLMAYFQHVEKSRPGNMRLINYGKTNEGRPLAVAVVGSPENMRMLEDIQKNNLRLCGFLNDKPGNSMMPVVVWLSFNVHGNEPSSSEVAISLLYDLVEQTNDSIRQWLKNTVAIIDPCLNPDGRDRYVQWYRQTRGSQPDPQPFTREHREPWPGGRGNHYMYDLNRDWAWQTQVESRQRMSLYHQWMPVIHADYHEQMENSPYYFAPAAEPYHDAITPWQRRFQVMMGKNHATYFDRQGWLYFTREYFDLFYPSYGDTYPIFNGSIGMTYEQAGHARAGLSILVDEDTLTLVNRIRHHHTTALSTIQMASGNASALNKAFQAYFKDARTIGSGSYSGFLIRKKSSAHWEQLVSLLSYNKIEYQELESGTAISGFHYPTMGVQRTVTENGDLWISVKQTQGNLVRVLFEPYSELADSATYDITSWALPFAYGLDAYAIEKAVGLKTRSTSNATVATQSVTPVNEVYGIIGNIRSTQDAVMVSKALQAGIRIRYSEKELVVSGKLFPRGSPIILSSENKPQMTRLTELMRKYVAEWTVLSSGLMESGVDMGSDKIHMLRSVRVALVVDESCSSTSVGDIWHYFDKELQYPLHLISSKELQSALLKQMDVLIFPDGQHKVLADKESVLKQWVKDGGRIIAMEQSVESMITGEWGVKWKKSTDNDDNNKLTPERYEDRERNALSSNTPGAVYKLKLDHSHPLAFGYPSHYFTLKQSSQLLETNATSWNVGWIDASGYVSGYVGSEARKQMKEGTLIAAQEIGRGQVVYFVDNPIFRGFWENGKRLLFNAVFYLGN
jgi:hypothetical protein